MKETYLLRMPAELKERLKEEADRKAISMNALILNALWNMAEKNKTKK